jgi:hypothetical protein
MVNSSKALSRFARRRIKRGFVTELIPSLYIKPTLFYTLPRNNSERSMSAYRFSHHLRRISHHLPQGIILHYDSTSRDLRGWAWYVVETSYYVLDSIC